MCYGNKPAYSWVYNIFQGIINNYAYSGPFIEVKFVIIESQRE